MDPDEQQHGQATVVRTSIIVLAGRIILLESVTAFILILLTFGLQIVQFPAEAFSLLFSLYVLGIMFLTAFKSFLILIMVISWINHSYEILHGEICQRSGILVVQEDDFGLRSVEEITISQTFFGKIFNYGTVIIVNPVLNKETMLYSIPNPYKYLKIIKSMIPKGRDVTILRGQR